MTNQRLYLGHVLVVFVVAGQFSACQNIAKATRGKIIIVITAPKVST